MIWWRPPLKQAASRWNETELARHLHFKGLATIICAKALFTPGFNEPAANDRDRLRW